ncbi:hypothetical protein F5X68DRAFT_264003 [Plectosphaerella plurivora]|uniref:Nephrocystin 3-like N-terminal domain-containing protein n=1 Tax=Plectosphaerella plurivora TaxID=936078 RepID=A0A9P8V5R5_9PEZI|nr:hypothetical protein F5X68DRAFT_264003 [Plectosphaerella plurivora]
MELLGAAASAFALLTIVAQVIKGIKTTTGATKERKRFREEVRALEDILQQLTDEVDDAEEGDGWRETLAALEAPGGPLGRLHVVLTELLSKLQTETGVKKTISALKWPFKESQIKDTMLAIEREKALLNLALSNNSRKLLQEIKATARTYQQTLDDLVATFAEESMNHAARLDDIQDRLGSIRLTQETTEEEKKRDEILRWLSPLDHSAQQSDYIRRREPGTGQWLLESNEYENWVKAHDQTIFCPGIPGAGKTILTSVIIEDLFNRSRDDPGMAVAFLYCNFNRQQEQTIEDILGSIARQLLQQMRSVPPTLADLYKSHGSRRKPSLGEICSALETAAQLCPRAIVVVDALDECQRSTRSHLLKHIFEIQSTHGINIFMTSRFIPEITDRFVQKTTIEIKAHESDLRLYLDSRMFSLQACVLRNPDLQQDIKAAIIKATDGMFLLAQLHMQSLEGKRSPRAIKTALEQLPSGTDAYDFAYDDAMLRIKSQHPDQAQLARQVLQWVTRSSRELHAQELQTALAIKPSDQDLDTDDIPELEDMLSACAGLVTVVAESSIVRLVH